MHIDSDNYRASGIKVFQFPGGEWHANVPKWRTDRVQIHAKIRTWDDMGKLLVVGRALRTQDVAVHVFAPYFPGARQDRNIGGLTPDTCQIYGKLFATIATTITVVDMHSPGGLHQLQSCFGAYAVTQIPSTVFIEDMIPADSRPDVVIIPDAGAVERSTTIADLFGVKTIQCGKERNYDTGELTGFTVPDISAYSRGTRFLIPDDICDGGGTFLGLLQEIHKQQPLASVDLFVTHGIFSKGLGSLCQFDNVYTTDSFYSIAHTDSAFTDNTNWLHTINLFPYYQAGLRP